MRKLEQTPIQSQDDTRQWESWGTHSHRGTPDLGKLGHPPRQSQGNTRPSKICGNPPSLLQGDIRPWESWGIHSASDRGTPDHGKVGAPT